MTILADSALKVAVVVLLALGASGMLRRRSAAARHWVLAVGMACAIAAPGLGLLVPSWSIALPRSSSVAAPVPSSSVTTGTGNPREAVEAEPPGLPSPPAAAPLSFAASAAQLLGMIWFLGASMLAGVLLAGVMRLKRIAAGASPITTGPWVDGAAHIARAIGLRRRVVLLQSEHPTLLVTWGWRRPRVILPAAARHWTGDRLRIVLQHELAHVHRGDWMAQILGELLRTLYWFNPFVWVACRRLRRDSEQACDDAVLSGGVDASDYAAHLLDLARTLNAGGRAHVPAPAMARLSSLEGRISAMLNTDLDRRPLARVPQMSAAAAFFAATLLVAGAAAQARYSTLSGTVVDQTNGVLPNATLVLTNSASQARHEVKSDRSGHFEFVGLPSGDYTLQVAQLGFTTLSESVAIARDLQRTIELQVGSLEETIKILDGPSDSKPDPDRAEKLRALRQKAQERQQRATEQCGRTGANPVGGNILQPWKIADVRPIYPATLSTTRTGGVVAMEALIGVDGTVRDVRVTSSPHPDLERAATEAVRQWEFTPTILNCTPIEVRMTVTATFVAAR